VWVCAKCKTSNGETEERQRLVCLPWKPAGVESKTLADSTFAGQLTSAVEIGLMQSCRRRIVDHRTEERARDRRGLADIRRGIQLGD